MQAQDATQLYLLKLWTWVEANKKALIAAVAAVAVIVLVYWFFQSQREQKELAAGYALAQLATGGAPTAAAFLKIAAEQPDTEAGKRALLLGATALFVEAKYPEAQAQFQKYRDQYRSSEFDGQAALGVAACLDVQGKTDLATGTYLDVTRNSADPAAAATAKFALARIYEAAGKVSDAMTYYEDVARSAPNGPFGNEAALRAMELRSKMPAPAPAKPATPAPATAIPAPVPAAIPPNLGK